MRKLTAGLFHAIDGVVEAPNLWQGDAFDDELGALLGGVMGRVDTVLMGRKGFTEWKKDFGEGGDPYFGPFINGVTKYVASRTLKGDIGWQNATLIEGDVPAFVRELKAKPGGEIAVMGGISLVRELFLAGLLDELTLITHPVIAGDNRRHLFQPGDPTTQLVLVDMQRTSRGNIVSTYSVRR
ncbi:MAG: dihydrofolate reductase family protein [Devosia sp.]